MRDFKILFILVFLLGSAACRNNVFQSPTVAPASLRDVPALRLNYRYEADVPPPPAPSTPAQSEERNAAVQADFDQNRPQEILDKTIAAPNGQRVLAVYHRVGDAEAAFRLDMYDAAGKFLRRITPETMAVDFPDIIVWSPDSTTVAFVAIARDGGINSLMPQPSPPADTNPAANQANTQANTETGAETGEANTNTEPPAPSAAPPGEAPPNVLTFRTEQIYICNSEGSELKPITQVEGLIYYYFVWSPDSSSLAALAATFQEWNYLKFQADKNNELFVPLGRPRIVEKNGRERILDDALTAVHPVWSPDSAKVAVGFFPQQIRIYDAIGDNPTQAAIPLRNQLLLSSQAYDQAKLREEQAAQGNVADNTQQNANASQPNTLPDEKTLISFQPIIRLQWVNDTELYFQTGYVKEFKTGESARSSLRWHRLVLSPQAVAVR